MTFIEYFMVLVTVIVGVSALLPIFLYKRMMDYSHYDTEHLENLELSEKLQGMVLRELKCKADNDVFRILGEGYIKPAGQLVKKDEYPFLFETVTRLQQQETMRRKLRRKFLALFGISDFKLPTLQTEFFHPEDMFDKDQFEKLKKSAAAFTEEIAKSKVAVPGWRSKEFMSGLENNILGSVHCRSFSQDKQQVLSDRIKQVIEKDSENAISVNSVVFGTDGFVTVNMNIHKDSRYAKELAKDNSFKMEMGKSREPQEGDKTFYFSQPFDKTITFEGNSHTGRGERKTDFVFDNDVSLMYNTPPVLPFKITPENSSFDLAALTDSEIHFIGPRMYEHIVDLDKHIEEVETNVKRWLNEYRFVLAESTREAVLHDARYFAIHLSFLSNRGFKEEYPAEIKYGIKFEAYNAKFEGEVIFKPVERNKGYYEGLKRMGDDLLPAGEPKQLFTLHKDLNGKIIQMTKDESEDVKPDTNTAPAKRKPPRKRSKKSS